MMQKVYSVFFPIFLKMAVPRLKLCLAFVSNDAGTIILLNYG